MGTPRYIAPPKGLRNNPEYSHLTERERKQREREDIMKWRISLNHYTSVKRPDMARKLAGIMTRQKRGSAAPQFGMTSGRVDRTALSRVEAGHRRVFKREGEPSPTKLRMVILLDMSGSMHGENMDKGLQMVRDLIEASRNVHTVTTEVWGHTSADLWAGDELAAEARTLLQGDFLVVKELWQEGHPIERLHEQVNDTYFWGNEDGFALDIVSQEVAKSTREDERLFFVVVSDGQPVYFERTRALTHTQSVVDRIRKSMGAGVISVSVSEELKEADQTLMYGKGSVVPYDHDNNKLAASIATAVGKALD